MKFNVKYRRGGKSKISF